MDVWRLDPKACAPAYPGGDAPPASGGSAKINGLPMVQVQVAGREKNSHLGVKPVNTSESGSLHYVRHTLQGNTLRICQENDCLRAETFLTSYANTNTLRFTTRVTNIAQQALVLSVPAPYSQAVCAYPRKDPIPFAMENGVLKVEFTEDYQARFFELQ